MPGSDKCKFHGGLTPKGLSSPHFKHGKYSSVLPDRLQERYNQALSDPELLSCKHELAILDARVSDLMQRVDTGEAGESWIGAKKSLKQFKQSLKEKDMVAVAVALGSLERWLGKGYMDWLSWRELMNAIALREKIAASERKRIIEAKQYVTVEQHAILISAVYQSVKEVVDDPEQLKAIGFKLAQLLNRPVPPGSPPEAVEVDR